jgi:N-methylhydantoinase A/oxoprolinase/acetone carboxylase beta subunit
VKTTSAGVLVAAQAASGPSGGIVCFSASAQAARVLVLDIVGSSSPSGTVQVEHSTAPNTAGTWVILSSPSFVAMTPAVITTGISFVILNPVGCYRTNFTALSSGTFAVSYQAQE